MRSIYKGTAATLLRGEVIFQNRYLPMILCRCLSHIKGYDAGESEFVTTVHSMSILVSDLIHPEKK